MEHSENVAKIAEALAAAQAEMAPAKHDSTNPHFKMRYASLASVLEATRPLAAHGISVVQAPRVGHLGHGENPGGLLVEVTTTLLHTSGEWISTALALKPRADDAQSIGSAITYGRRYGLAALAGIASDEDDDGNGATEPPRRGPGRPRSEERPTAAPQSRPAPPAAPPAGAPPAASQAPAALPPADATPPRGVPGGAPVGQKATPDQKMIGDMLRELGFTGKAEGRAEVSRLLNRELASVADLTPEETTSVLFALRGAVNAAKRQPDENVRAVIEKIRDAAYRIGEDPEIFSGSVLGRRVASLADLTDDERADVLLRLQTAKAEAKAQEVAV